MATNDVSYTYLNGSQDEIFNNNVHVRYNTRFRN